MNKKIFFISLFLVFLSFVVEGATKDIAVIEALPRRESAVIDIEVTKINSKKIEGIHDAVNKKLIFELDEAPSEKMAIFEKLREAETRKGRVRDISEPNLKWDAIKNENGKYEVSVFYKNLPAQFYAASLGGGNKLETLYKIESWRELTSAQYEFVPNFIDNYVELDIINRNSSDSIRWIPNADNPERVEMLIGKPSFKRISGEENLFMGISVKNSAEAVLEFPTFEGKGRIEFFLKGNDEKSTSRIQMTENIKELNAELWMKAELKDVLLAKELNLNRDVKLYVSGKNKARTFSISRDSFYAIPEMRVATNDSLSHRGSLSWYNANSNLNCEIISLEEAYIKKTGMSIPLGSLNVEKSFSLSWSKNSTSSIVLGGAQETIVGQKVNPVSKIGFKIGNKTIAGYVYIKPNAPSDLEGNLIASDLGIDNSDKYVSISAMKAYKDYIDASLYLWLPQSSVVNIYEIFNSENEINSEIITAQYESEPHIYLLGAPINENKVSYQLLREWLLITFINYKKINLPKLIFQKDYSSSIYSTSFNFKPAYIPGTMVELDFQYPTTSISDVDLSYGTSGIVRGLEHNGKKRIEIHEEGGSSINLDMIEGEDLSDTEIKLSGNTIIKVGFKEKGNFRIGLFDWKNNSTKNLTITITLGNKKVINHISLTPPIEYIRVTDGELIFKNLKPGDKNASAEADIKFETRGNSEKKIEVNFIKYGNDNVNNKVILDHSEKINRNIPSLEAILDLENNIIPFTRSGAVEKSFKLKGVIGEIPEKQESGEYKGTIQLKMDILSQ